MYLRVCLNTPLAQMPPRSGAEAVQRQLRRPPACIAHVIGHLRREVRVAPGGYMDMAKQ